MEQGSRVECPRKQGMVEKACHELEMKMKMKMKGERMMMMMIMMKMKQELMDVWMMNALLMCELIKMMNDAHREEASLA